MKRSIKESHSSSSPKRPKITGINDKAYNALATGGPKKADSKETTAKKQPQKNTTMKPATKKTTPTAKKALANTTAKTPAAKKAPAKTTTKKPTAKKATAVAKTVPAKITAKKVAIAKKTISKKTISEEPVVVEDNSGNDYVNNESGPVGPGSFMPKPAVAVYVRTNPDETSGVQIPGVDPNNPELNDRNIFINSVGRLVMDHARVEINFPANP